MNYKLINRLDPLIYLGLVLVGFILPEVVYRIFLFDFTAVLTENEAMIVRSIGGPLYFAAMAFFLLGGNAENGKQLNIIRYSGGLGLIAFAVLLLLPSVSSSITASFIAASNFDIRVSNF